MHGMAYYLWHESVESSLEQSSVAVKHHIQLGLTPSLPGTPDTVSSFVQPVSISSEATPPPKSTAQKITEPTASEAPLHNDERKLAIKPSFVATNNSLAAVKLSHSTPVVQPSAPSSKASVYNNGSTSTSSVHSKENAPLTTALFTAKPAARESPLQLSAKDVRYARPPTAPTYPRTARRRGQEGEVLLRLSLLSTGEISRIQIARTSGTPALDKAAVEAAYKWRFHPAQHQGKTVAAEVLVPVKFSLEEGR